MIVGINFKNIEVNRFSVPKGQLRIDSNTKILDVAETKIPWAKEKVVSIGFTFQTRYWVEKEKLDVGSIILSGEVLYKDKISEIKKTWQKKKALPEDINIKVINGILRRAIVRAVDLSEVVGLPPPIGIPVVKSKKEQKDVGYIG